jgi:hypothetical protein
MRRFALVLCLAVPLTAVGTVVAHAVAYRLLGAPSEGVHGYLAHLPQLLTVLALPVLLALAIAGRARAPKAWPFAAASVAAFVAQEHLERLAHTASCRSSSIAPSSCWGSCCRFLSRSSPGWLLAH